MLTLHGKMISKLLAVLLFLGAVQVCKLRPCLAFHQTLTHYGSTHSASLLTVPVTTTIHPFAGFSACPDGTITAGTGAGCDSKCRRKLGAVGGTRIQLQDGCDKVCVCQFGKVSLALLTLQSLPQNQPWSNWKRIAH